MKDKRKVKDLNPPSAWNMRIWDDDKKEFALLIILTILFASGSAAVAHLNYGDWTCAFEECVGVKGSGGSE